MGGENVYEKYKNFTMIGVGCMKKAYMLSYRLLCSLLPVSVFFLACWRGASSQKTPILSYCYEPLKTISLWLSNIGGVLGVIVVVSALLTLALPSLSFITEAFNEVAPDLRQLASNLAAAILLATCVTMVLHAMDTGTLARMEVNGSSETVIAFSSTDLDNQFYITPQHMINPVQRYGVGAIKAQLRFTSCAPQLHKNPINKTISMSLPAELYAEASNSTVYHLPLRVLMSETQCVVCTLVFVWALAFMINSVRLYFKRKHTKALPS